MEKIQAPGTEDFADCSRWLTVAGLIEILIGGICGLCGLLFVLLAPFFRQNPTTAHIARGGMLTVNALALIAAAALFVCLGIGTMRARRWARDLMLIGAWIWLIVGASVLILIFVMLPRKIQEMSGPEPGSGEIAAVMAIVGVITGFLYVVLPGLFVLFYSARNVRKTFQNRDPSAPWTSKCPLSVLTLCQFLACGALTSLAALFYTDAVPMGDRVVTGIPARLLLVSATVLYCYLTWAVYRLKLHSWWMNFFFTILCFAWLFWSYKESDLARLAPDTGLSLRGNGQILSQDLWAGKVFSMFVAAFGAGYVIFLFLIKKHFKRQPEESGRSER